MNRMLKFESFVSEGVRDVLRPKSKEEIFKSLDVANKEPQELLLICCFYGILDGVKKALDMGVDPTIRFNEAIGIASYYNHPDIVEYLLKDETVDASDLYNFAINVAEEGEYKDVISLLLKDDKVRSKLSRFKISKLNKLLK